MSEHFRKSLADLAALYMHYIYIAVIEFATRVCCVFHRKIAAAAAAVPIRTTVVHIFLCAREIIARPVHSASQNVCEKINLITWCGMAHIVYNRFILIGAGGYIKSQQIPQLIILSLSLIPLGTRCSVVVQEMLLHFIQRWERCLYHYTHVNRLRKFIVYMQKKKTKGHKKKIFLLYTGFFVLAFENSHFYFILSHFFKF